MLILGERWSGRLRRRLLGALDHRGRYHSVRLTPRELVFQRPGWAGDLGHSCDQRLTDDGVVLGPGPVGEAPGSEVAQLGDDGVQVTQRLAHQDERGEQHGLLPAHVGGGEQRLHRWGRGEQPGIEGVHEIVAARGDQVEACLEGLYVDAHWVSCLGVDATESMRAVSLLMGGCEPPSGWWLSAGCLAGSRHAQRPRRASTARTRRLSSWVSASPSFWKIP